MTDADERIRRAIELGLGNKTKVGMILLRWAGVLRANDPSLADGLERHARTLVRREVVRRQKEFLLEGGAPLGRRNEAPWKYRQMRDAWREA